RLEVGVAEGGFTDEAGVVTGANIGGDDGSGGVLEGEEAVVPLEASGIVHHAGVHGGLGAKVCDLLGEAVEDCLVESQGTLGDGAGGGQAGEDAVADFGGK